MSYFLVCLLLIRGQGLLGSLGLLGFLGLMGSLGLGDCFNVEIL